MKWPDFFIVGAPKCGTTAMFQFLGQHPQIFVPARKEQHFFGSDLTKTDFYPQTEEQYLENFSCADEALIWGEASVHYLMSTQAPGEILDKNPAAKIIIMLRDPVEVLYAEHSQLVFGGFETIKDFEAALAAEPERRAGKNIPKGAQLLETLYYTETVKYAEQIKRYQRTFPTDQVHIIFYDDFKRDLAKVYRETLLFLEVDAGFEPTFRRINPNEEIRSQALARWLRRFPESTTLGSIVIPMQIRWRLNRFNTIRKIRPPLPKPLEKQLRQNLTLEIEALETLLERDLSSWKTDKP